MRRMIRPGPIVALLLVAIATGPAAAGDRDAAGRALAYLAAEVPAWSAEHRCFSCHHDGDAARALYLGAKLGRTVAADATAEADGWLGRVERWEAEGGKGPVGDRRLARVQFASALLGAIEAGRVADRGALAKAAAIVAADQAEDGSWGGDDANPVGSPATWGRAVATWRAVGVLRAADAAKYRDAIGRGAGWIGRLEPENVPAAAVLLIEPGGSTPGRVEAALGLLAKAQGDDGGWGPYRDASAEAYDTSLALLALDGHRDDPGVAGRIGRGRAYLAANQREDGSWAETTRPADRESHAQRASTTAWAAIALLATGRAR